MKSVWLILLRLKIVLRRPYTGLSALVFILLTYSSGEAVTQTLLPYGSPGYEFHISNGSGGIRAAPFGTFLSPSDAGGCTIYSTVKTPWALGTSITLRHTFTLPPNVVVKSAQIGIAVDNDILGISINGTSISGVLNSEGCARLDQVVVNIPPRLLMPGPDNHLEVVANDRGVASFVDVELRADLSSLVLSSRSGDNQTGAILEALPQPLVVQVTDPSGDPPTTTVPITFSVTQEPTGVGTHAVLSNPNTTVPGGSTTASTNFILGDRPGLYQVTASCASCTPQSVTFTATAICASHDPCIVVRADPILGCVMDDGRHFNPVFWNDAGGTQYSNNCYAYATNTYVPSGGRAAMPQPGRGGGLPSPSYAENTCEGITARAIADGLTNLGSSAFSCDSSCPAGSRKIALVVDPGRDYHWYREDSDGTWSHKPGQGRAKNFDASGPSHIITDPRLANRDYSAYEGANYAFFCSCFCTSCDEHIE